MKKDAGYSGGFAASVPIAFSYVFCMKCRKSGAFVPQNPTGTPQVSLAPCRLKSFWLRQNGRMRCGRRAFARKIRTVEPRSTSRAPHSQQNKKAIPYGMTFCFGGDKQDRTADLMTASCYRFVILSVFTFNLSVPSVKSAGFHKILSIASTCFRAHLGHNLGQESWTNSGDSKRS